MSPFIIVDERSYHAVSPHRTGGSTPRNSAGPSSWSRLRRARGCDVSQVGVKCCTISTGFLYLLTYPVCVGLGLAIQQLILFGTVPLPGTPWYLFVAGEWSGLQRSGADGADRPKKIGARSESPAMAGGTLACLGSSCSDLEAFRGQTRGGVLLPPITAQSYENAPDNSILSPTQISGRNISSTWSHHRRCLEFSSPTLPAARSSLIKVT